MSNFYILTGYDKVLHFAAGFILALIAYGVDGQSYLYGVVADTSAGVAKELYDWLINHRYATTDSLNFSEAIHLS